MSKPQMDLKISDYDKLNDAITAAAGWLDLRGKPEMARRLRREWGRVIADPLGFALDMAEGDPWEMNSHE